MEKLLADTSAWIASFYRTGHEDLKKIMQEAILDGKLYVTGMVQLELLRGVKNEKDYDLLKKRLDSLPFITTPDMFWCQVAKLSLELRSRGVQSTVPDLFIAQTAITNHCLLIHCDSDYERIAKQTSLKTLSFIS